MACIKIFQKNNIKKISNIHIIDFLNDEIKKFKIKFDLNEFI